MRSLGASLKSQCERCSASPHDRPGNLPPMTCVFPDYAAPLVRVADGERELVLAMSSPQFALKGKATDPGVANVPNTASP